MRQTKQNDSYEGDFYKWIKHQAVFLKRGEFSKLDIENLVEEIETLGRSEKRALESYLVILLIHLLKIQHQPKKHSKSWDLSIKNSRRKIQYRLKESPSLKRHLPKILEEAYADARIEAAEETGLSEKIFPETCPWTLKEILI